MTLTDIQKAEGISTVFRQEVGKDFYSPDDPSLRSADAYTMVVPCPGRRLEYVFNSDYSGLSLWVGKKINTPMTVNKLALDVKPWHKKMDVDLVDLYGDISGLIENSLNQWLNSSRRDRALLAATHLNAGETLIGFDGVPLFSLSHPAPEVVGGIVQPNLVVTPFTVASYRTMYEMMTGWKDLNGISMRRRPTHLVVATDLAITARLVLAAERPFINSATALDVSSGANSSATAQNNLNKALYTEDQIVLLVDPELTAGTAYLLDCSTINRPIIIGEQRGPTPNDNLVSAMYRETPKAFFSIEYFAAIGAGHWMSAVKLRAA